MRTPAVLDKGKIVTPVLTRLELVPYGQANFRLTFLNQTQIEQFRWISRGLIGPLKKKEISESQKQQKHTIVRTSWGVHVDWGGPKT